MADLGAEGAMSADIPAAMSDKADNPAAQVEV